MLRSSIDDPYHQHQYTEVNLFYIFLPYHAEWNNMGRKFFQQQEDIYFTKENHQNYGWCTYYKPF
jgi:hypothetical protein